MSIPKYAKYIVEKIMLCVVVSKAITHIAKINEHKIDIIIVIHCLFNFIIILYITRTIQRYSIKQVDKTKESFKDVPGLKRNKELGISLKSIY